MKITVIAHYNPNMFPTLHYLASELGERGHQIQFMSVFEPNQTGAQSRNLTWVPVTSVKGWRRHFPILRSAYLAMTGSLISFKPDLIIGEHEFLAPALLYNALARNGNLRIVGYFCDYYSQGSGMRLLKWLANRLDAYADVCHLRLEWRQQDWPHMNAEPFVVRQAPLRRINASFEPHVGGTRVIYTGSKNALGMNRDRLSRFIQRLCEHGISVDWYLAGSSAMKSSEQLREEARTLSDHPLYSVCAPVEKTKLMQVLRGYDAGLFWAPVMEGGAPDDFMSRYLLSAASNKIGEYIAAGLVVAHTGNPGLSYLPDEVCAVFDPADPEAGADQLAAALADRQTVERKRQAALDYHLNEMNFEAQAAPLIEHIMKTSA